MSKRGGRFYTGGVMERKGKKSMPVDGGKPIPCLRCEKPRGMHTGNKRRDRAPAVDIRRVKGKRAEIPIPGCAGYIPSRAS